jgi:hypothetical protein
MIARAAAAVIFVVAVSIVLARTVPDVIDRPLQQHTDRVPQPLPVPVASSANGRLVRSLALHAADAAALTAADQIRLTVGTYGTTPALESGALAIGNACTFTATPSRLRENDPLVFRRDAGCEAASGAASVLVTLIFEVDSPVEARAALWGGPLTATESAPLVLQDGAARMEVMGRQVSVRSAVRTSRAGLLAYMWHLPVATVWICFACGGVLVLAGAAMPRGSTREQAAGAFALAAGLAACYTIVVPPLQAPDEPDHLLSYAMLSERPELAEATSAWARQIHFDRITFGGDERFAPADRDRPGARDWPAAEVFAENVRLRSSTTTRFWQALEWLAPSRPAHALLFFRLADTLLFAAAMATAVALLARAGAAGEAGALAPVLLLLPTLPFFAMQMSELPFTLAAFVLIGAAALLLASEARGWITGSLLGAATTFIAAGPRSGWPMLIVIAALCASRLLLAGRASRERTDIFGFWLGVAAPGLLLFATGALWVPSPFYEQWRLPSFDPRAGLSSTHLLIGLAIGAVTGAAIETALRRAGGGLTTAAASIARAACAVAAAAIVVMLAWSIWQPMPVLATVESTPPSSAPVYVTSVMWAWATPARVRGFDFLTWTSLWGGFGWLSAILPSIPIALVTALVSALASGTLVLVARDRAGRGAIIAAAAMAGIALSVAAAALSSFGLHRNVHGRYLLGGCIVGLCVLVVPVVARATRDPESVRSAALLALVCAIHGVSLTFLLERYFG